MAANNWDALHLAEPGNLAWLFGGADFNVSLADVPVAEAVVTAESLVLVASSIERGRLEAEELPEGVEPVYADWFEPAARSSLVREAAGAGRVVSDSAASGWATTDLWELRVPLTQPEMARYREVCKDAATAFSEVLLGLELGISEAELSGRLAEALHARRLQVLVLLVGTGRRLQEYRHPLPSSARIRERVMAVTCVRRHGLIANLTRNVSFAEPSSEQRRKDEAVLAVEKTILDLMHEGIALRDVFGELKVEYRKQGFPEAWRDHHQGGPCGYFTRDVVASPGSERLILDGAAYAWNPSLPGSKIEDTVLLARDGLEVLTIDEHWPTRGVGGRRRPEVLLR